MKVFLCGVYICCLYVGVVRLGDGRVVCLTETQKGSIIIDPNTLETLGKFDFNDPFERLLLHSAHPIVTKNEMLTLLPDLVNPGYLAVRMKAGSNGRRVIGRINCRGGPTPGWVHSFPVTENYIIVPEMPLRYCVRNLLRAEPTPLYKFQWHPESKAFVHVMCRFSGSLVCTTILLLSSLHACKEIMNLPSFYDRIDIGLVSFTMMI